MDTKVDSTLISFVESDNLRVEWHYIGEGRLDEYNPNDPNDVKLLRFDVLTKDDDTDWESLPDCSYCTLIPLESSDDVKNAALKYIHDGIAECIESGRSLRLQCEYLSWIEPNMFEY